MKSVLKLGCFTVLVFCLLCTCKEKGKVSSPIDVIWYDKPASEWMEALPVGNGRLGAMVFGDPVHERIQLNEDSMWPGGPDFGDSKGSIRDLEYIRALILKGKVHQADKEIVERFSYKGITRSHQTLGDLYLDFNIDSNTVTDYRRSLDLEKGIISVEYKANNHRYTQQTLASFPDNVLAIQLKTDHPDGLNLKMNMNRPQDRGHSTATVTNPARNEISMNGMVTQYGGSKYSEPFPMDYGVKFESRLKVQNNGGKVSSDNGALILEGVKEATIYLVAHTSFYHPDYARENDQVLKNLQDKSFEEIKNSHTEDFASLYNRVDLDLEGPDLDSLPTDFRLQKVKDGYKDIDLEAKLFKYGRYLLISSSRPGTNPANLQGIWNEHIEAPWNADYHVNVNIQMNYWPAEVTNLRECHEPLFDFIDRMIERGRRTAKEQYGIERGAVIHHTSDLWGPAFMRAAQAYWGSWIHGGGWIVQHYYEHFRFTQDTVFLKERAYPAMKAIAEFYLDWLVWDEETGMWVSFPETSPENSYFAADGKPAAVSYGASMAHQIIGEVFDNVIDAAEILDVSEAFVQEVKDKRKDLTPGVVVGEDGRVLEWTKPYDEPEKGHRHMSHLYALHPGDEITSQNLEAFEAAKKTIDYRLQHGGAKTGWSRAWMINFNARLLDAPAAEENINKFLELSTADNMFDMHPPFQIDGNFGFTAGVTELLLQSHEGFLRILPALPPSWKTGHIKGIKARGNVELDIQWKEGTLVEIVLDSPVSKKVDLKYGDREVEILLEKNKAIKLDRNLKMLD